MSNKINYLNTVPCMEAMDRIASKTFIRLSYEYGICMIRRELIPSMGSICLKSLISNLGSMRGNNMAVYINLFDILTLGLVELNFDETEKATNILPDFRIGPKGCLCSGMEYEKYLKYQMPIEKYNGRVIEIESNKQTWDDLVREMIDACYINIGLRLEDYNLITIFLNIFLEEVFYDLGMNKQKDYAYKLFDILYFNYKEEDDLWGTDVMPEYKLMVKDDTYSELKIEKSIEEFKKENDNGLKPLRYQ